MSQDEVFPLVDEQGTVIGKSTRREVHGNPSLMHPVVHCIVVGSGGRLLLQQRSMTKDIQPGRWDTSVGGHVMFGESVETAVVREVSEELGLSISFAELQFLHRYVMRSEVETELVYTYLLRSDGPFRAEVGEATELRYFSVDAITERLATGFFTPNFEDEFARYASSCLSSR